MGGCVSSVVVGLGLSVGVSKLMEGSLNDPCIRSIKCVLMSLLSSIVHHAR